MTNEYTPIQSGDEAVAAAGCLPAPTTAPPGAIPAKGTTARRIGATAVAAGAGSLLTVAAILEASPDGVGTHEQLNLPACGWVAVADLPCPTCGMTTAFAHAADGHLWTSFLTQPMGFLLAVATAMSLLVGIYVAVTGSAVAGVFLRLWGRWTPWLLGAALMAAWAFKIVRYKELWSW